MVRFVELVALAKGLEYDGARGRVGEEDDEQDELRADKTRPVGQAVPFFR